MKRVIHGAERYDSPGDLWVITCLFNPSHYAVKRELYERFMAPLRAGGVPTITVECAFGDDAFELEPHKDVVQVRAGSVMFQKERLLNLAVKHLPPACTKVAWLDADVLFERPDWVVATSRALDTSVVVQPFSECLRLPRNHSFYAGCGRRWESFAAVYERDPTILSAGRYDPHGHVGFAWAAQRGLLDTMGLRDHDIGGHSDHLMAHAMVGDWNTTCFRHLVGPAGPYAEGTRHWAQRFYGHVQGKLSAVPGALLHMWHGRIADRRYWLQSLRLRAFGFDPAKHITLDAQGVWAWTPAGEALNEVYSAYFARRREDG